LDLLLVKLLLTPLLMAAVSYASRRWGGAIGGLLAGLPLTAGPISIYLAAEQGRDFAATAALGSIAGVGAVTLSYLVYTEASRRLSAWPTMGLTALAYGVAMIMLRGLDLSLGPILFIDFATILLVFIRRSRSQGVAATAVYSTWDLPARMLTSTAMVLFVTACAHLIGPHYSGLFSTIPVIGWPLIAFAHRQRGREEAMAVLLGILKGTLGLIAFYMVVYLMLPASPAIATYALALLVSGLLTMGWLVQRRLAPASL
jgi:hypothetical protein